MELRSILQGIETKKVTASLDIDIKGVTQNSKNIQDGYIFVALKGARFDGNEFIPNALKAGAVCVVTDTEQKDGVPYILVDSPRQAMSAMLSNFYSRPQDSFKYSVGITGTNGKTSTSLMLKNIFEAAGYKVGLIGTMKYLIGDEEFNSESNGNLLTTPDSENFWNLLAMMRDRGVDVLVMEVSSHALALDKIYGMHFSCGVFTNLTRDHLDFHLNFENYLEAKSKLFSMCDTGIVNIDDEAGEKIASTAECDVKTYAIDSIKSDYTAKNTRFKGALGVEYEFLTQGIIFRIKVDIPGKFTVYNSLAAASAAISLGISSSCVIKGFSETRRIQGRVDRVDIDAPYSVIIDFAHTPDAMENVINTVKGFAEGRIITLFGCGGDRDRTKRPIMGKMATEMSDFVIVTSDNCRTENIDVILADITDGIEKDNYTVVPDRREAIHTAMDMAEKNDVILLLGKGHEEYEIDANGKHPFSEYDIVVAHYKETK